MAISDYSIAIECWADTILIEILVPSVQGYNHAHSCFKVEALMTKGKLSDQFAVGIIDDDKKKIKYLDEFEIVKDAGIVKLWSHKSKPHYFIQFSPAVERFILDVCRNAEINLSDFELPNELSELLKITKHLASKGDSNIEMNRKRLRRLFSSLAYREDIEEIRLLKRWITLLKEKNYQIDKEELRNV